MLSERAVSLSASPTQAIDAKAKKMEAEDFDVVNYGAGEPDFDTPEHIRNAATEALNKGFTRYTHSSGIFKLREAICAKLLRDNGLKYDPSQVIVSNGAKHSLSNIFATLLNEGDEVIIFAPYWVSYTEQIKLFGGVPVIIKNGTSDNYRPDLASLARSITNKTKAIIVNSPSNPVGVVLNKEELETIAEIAVDKGVYVLSDEVYEKFIYSGEHISIASLGAAIKDLTIVINGASKTYAMTGWRLGFTASNSEVATVMGNIQSHTASNPNSIAQYAFLAALSKSQDCVARMRSAFEERRRYMLERFDNLPQVSYITPDGAFYLFVNVAATFKKKFNGCLVQTSEQLADLLLEEALVAVTPGTGFGAPEYIRLSYAVSMDKIKTGLDRIESFLNQLED